MKYLIVLGDGMADRPLATLNGKTPLMVAKKPFIDALVTHSQIGLVKTVPDGFAPGSDVANLAIIGYPPTEFYTGRSPLEALSIGIDMQKDDYALRCNLVTIQDNTMIDYSAGSISTEEASILMEALEAVLGSDFIHFYAGVSFRNCMVYKGELNSTFTPPHDITNQKIDDFLPKGEDSQLFLKLFYDAHEVLKAHPLNLQRIKDGKKPATHIWLWGAGKKAVLPSFKSVYGLKGVVVSAVDLLRGIAVGADMAAPKIPDATGLLDTNIDGKIASVIEHFGNGFDFAYLHIEAPDECGHQGDLNGKIAAIEMVDYALGQLFGYLASKKEDFVIALLPDHATPIDLMTHTDDPVPYAIYKSYDLKENPLKYNENDAKSGVFLYNGQDIIKTMLEV